MDRLGKKKASFLMYRSLFQRPGCREEEKEEGGGGRGEDGEGEEEGGG